MADNGSIVAGFLKGFTNNVVGQMQERDKAEAERRKAKMLEQLRVETQKELTIFEESRPGYQAELEGRRIRNEADQEKLRQDRELFPLDMQAKRQQIEFGAEDQQMQREAHRDSLATNAESRRASRASRSGGGKKSLESGGLSNDVYREYNRTMTDLVNAGANPSELASYQSRFMEGVYNGKWTDAQQMRFLVQTRKNFTDGYTAVSGPNKGKRRPARLGQVQSATLKLDAKLK